MTDSVIEDPAPLHGDYVPARFVDREDEQAFLNDTFSAVTTVGVQNLVIDGPRGTGKTHLVRKRLHDMPDTVNTCYVSCRRNNSQYKVLTEIYHTLFGETIDEGHHTATLQEELKNRLRLQTVIVLDDLDFLLLNNGDNLLYYLSRGLPKEVTLVLIAANNADLESQLEERTYSSLHPRRLRFEPYTTEELFEILAARAQQSLTAESLHRQALQYITSTISNPRIGLHWLQTAGETTNDAITDSLVKQVQSQAYHRYVDTQLEDFTEHHYLTYQAIQELTITQNVSIRTGQIYSRYQHLCERFETEALSRRRISDFLKHLELLDLIDVEYHYGGKRGRTREIQLNTLSKD